MDFRYLRFWRVNFFDWLWFFFKLRSNEFHPSLDLWNWFTRYGTTEGLCRHRGLAHRIDIALKETKHATR